MIERPFLFEATRMIARSWTGKSPTGIDRVCNAYLRHFGPRAQAVVQHRGVSRILSAQHSDELFAMLGDMGGTIRRRMMGFAPRAWVEGVAREDAGGAIYLNVSHTDFDLPSHSRWVRECRLRPVYLLHDLIPITHARYCRPRAVTRHRGRVVNALQSAAGIVVNSRSTAGELQAFAQQECLPLPPLMVAPLAGAELGRRANPASISPSYFLCLGTIEKRKNHRLLLEVWLRLIAQTGSDTPRLVILGQWGARSSAVREMLKRHPALRRYVTLITRCSDRELGGWVAGAQALLMPTLAEGFGLPMVEALAMGTPVIASNLPCFRETGQAIPCLLDPMNAAAWARVIASFSDPGGERQRQLQLLGRYRPPVWEDHFAGVEDWLATLPRFSDQVGTAADRRLLHRLEGNPPTAAMTRQVAGAEGGQPEQLFQAIEACP